MRKCMQPRKERRKMSTISVGNHEYSLERGQLHIFLLDEMRTITFDPLQTLALLTFLKSHHSAIEQTAQHHPEPQPPSSLQERVNRLFECKEQLYEKHCSGSR